MDYFFLRPETEDGKQAILSFLDKEAECDEHNARQMEILMFMGDRTKTQVSNAKASIKRWIKNMESNIKFYKDIRTHSLGNDRSYYLWR